MGTPSLDNDSKLVRAGWVLPGAGEAVIHDGAVLVEAGAIKAVGGFKDLRRDNPDCPVLGTTSDALIPGLINAHHHSHATSNFVHGVGDDLLEPWIHSMAGMRHPAARLNTLLSCVRQLRSGVTTVVDVHSGVGDAQSYSDAVDERLQAYDEAGMRVAFATGQTMQSFLIHGDGEDAAFANSLPPDLKARTEAYLEQRSSNCMAGDEYLAVVESRVIQYSAHPRIDVWFGPPGPQWVSERLLLDIVDKARSLDTGVQTHCLESHYEMLHGRRSYGMPTVLHLRDLGVLDARFSLAHGVWLTREEIEVLSETGAAVSHNPSSNLRLRAGVAPLNAMLASGMTVALGMDGTTLNEDEDMFTEMRLAMRLHREPRLSGSAPAAEDVFNVATAGGARLLRKEKTLGRLAPGHRADMILLNLDRLRWPWVAPEADPAQLIYLQARAGDVHTVLVEGETVLMDGQPTRFDLQDAARALMEDLQAQAIDGGARDFMRELKPHLEAWYRAWEGPLGEPYAGFNAED